MSFLDNAKATQFLKEILHLEKEPTNGSEDMTTVNGKPGSERLDESNATSNAHPIIRQEIKLTSSDEKNSFAIFGNDVVVTCSKMDRSSGSSKVKISSIVNSGWENRYYFGQLVAAHLSRDYLAYTVKLPATTDVAVRVIRRNSRERVLLRGMHGAVVDISFAQTRDDILLASVDEYGNLFVHAIVEDGDKLTGKTILEVDRRVNNATPYHRVIWCPYVPDLEEEGDQQDVAKLLVATNNNSVEIWNVEVVHKEYGSGPITVLEKVKNGLQRIREHRMPISDAAFSPDGTALATTGYDGTVKFFQVCTEEPPPSADGKKEETIIHDFLHQWNPHKESPLSCLFFLDNLKNPPPDVQFWKFAITGANRNRELKVWNCATWECLQTIRFRTDNGDNLEPEMKVALSESAEFLVLTDVVRKVLYVLQINQDSDRNLAQITSLSEFPLNYPILCFGILSAGRKKLKQVSEDDQQEESPLCENVPLDMEDELKDGESYVNGVVIKLIYIQPNSLQECHIAFQPESSVPDSVGSCSTMSQDSAGFKDRLSDSFDTASSDQAANSEVLTQLKSAMTAAAASSQMMVSRAGGGQVLLTPDVFTSPQSHHKDPVTPVAASKLDHPYADTERTLKSLVEAELGNNLIGLEDYSMPASSWPPSAPPALGGSHDSDTSPLPLSSAPATLARRISGADDVLNGAGSRSAPEVRRPLHSTGSSPSLEVQEILTKSLQNLQESLYPDQDAKAREMTDASMTDITEGLKSLLGQGSTNSLSARPEGFDEKTQTDNGDPIPGVRWPKVPEVPKSSHEWPRNKAEDLFEAVELPPEKDWPAMMVDKNFLDRLSHQLEASTAAMQQVSLLLGTQQMEWSHVSKNVESLHLQMAAASQTYSSGTIQSDMHSSIKTLLQKHRQAETSSLNSALKTQEDRILSTLSQVVNNSIINRIDATVRMEFQNAVIPEVTRKLSSCDAVIRDSCAKAVESKAFVGAVSQSVTASLQSTLKALMHDAFNGAILPSFDKMTKNMFLQINDAFHRGTKEFLGHLEAHGDKQLHENQTFVTSQLQDITDGLHHSMEQASTTAADEMEKRMSAMLLRFEETFTSSLCSRMHDQMETAIKEHQTVIGATVANAIRSRAVTPVPVASVDPQLMQAQIMHLLQQGQVNAAFQQALSAADLSLVVFTCQKANLTQVFQGQCQLQQPVLLSLIHQMTADLSTDTELKQNVLQDAIMSLEFSDPVTKNHAPVVLETVVKKMRQFLDTNPDHKAARQMRVLHLLAKNSQNQ